MDILAKEGEVKGLESAWTKMNGTTLFICESARVVKDKKGRILYYDGTVEDITRRRQAEEKLKESEGKYRSLYKDASIGIFHSTIEGRFIDLNPALAKMLGYETPQEVIDKVKNIAAEIYVNPPKRDETIIAMLAKGKTLKTEELYVRKDGSRWIGNLNLRHVFDEHVNLLFLEGFVEDITQYRHAKEILRESERMLQTVMDNFPGVVFWKDRQSIYLGCNQSFAITVGLKDPTEIVGKTDFDMPWKSSESIKYLKDDFAVMEFGKARFHIIERLRHFDGQINWIDTSKLPLKDSTGQVVGVIGVSHDISSIKKAEKELTIANKNLLSQVKKKEKLASDLILVNIELEEQNTEIKQYAADLINANKELDFQSREKEKRAAELIIANKELASQNEEKDKLALELVSALAKKEASDNLKTAFMNNISHEIRTPLNGILGVVPIIIQNDITNDDKEELMEILMLSSNRLMKTIENTIDLSLLITDNMEVYTKPVSVSLILTSVIESFHDSYMRKNLGIKMQFPENADSFLLNTDGKILQKAVFELVDNSIKFTKKGSITIGFELVNKNIEIFVEDTGKGIEKKFQDKVFERFMQEDVSVTREEDGSGLGLSIAQGMIQLLGGKIRLESTKHIGTSVFLTLPHITSTASYEKC